MAPMLVRPAGLAGAGGNHKGRDVPEAAAWQRAVRLLCVRLGGVDQVVTVTPALRALKESVQDRTIALLTSSAGAEAARLAAVDEVLVYDAPWLEQSPPRVSSQPDRAGIEALRSRSFDAAVIFADEGQCAWPAAMLCLLADIPLRLAFSHDQPHQLLSDWVADGEPPGAPRHPVRRQLDLVAAVGAQGADDRLYLQTSDAAQTRVQRLLEERRWNPERPWVVIHPGADVPANRYPAEHFARVAHILTANHGWQVVFTGAQPERPLVESIRATMDAPSLTLAGRLSLEEQTALLAIAPLLITSHGSPVHLAAAGATPVVDLHALTGAYHAPWRTPYRALSHHVPCAGCGQRVCPLGHGNCLRMVSPERVALAAVDLLRDVGMGHSATPALAGASDGFRVAPWFRAAAGEALTLLP